MRVVTRYYIRCDKCGYERLATDAEVRQHFKPIGLKMDCPACSTSTKSWSADSPTAISVYNSNTQLGIPCSL